ncbi:MAG: hypothetical protein HC769_13065 [Cyanobacteria bacterium CRU_2_1]|nr:hypothetical protein [Cyanobacteria bacterium RU_5_0]NJR59684.1 hypothetical protein [Cyanobacteria bacterium CRU_2_1]
MASKNYSSKEVDLAELITELRDFFDTRNYRVQRRDGPSGGIILDALKSGNPRDLLGLSLALTTRITFGPEVTRVWIGNQKWVDKIIVGFVGLLVFVLIGEVNISIGCYFDTPQFLYLLLKMFSMSLMILPAIGAYLQYKVTQDTWNAIEDHVALRSTATP